MNTNQRKVSYGCPFCHETFTDRPTCIDHIKSRDCLKQPEPRYEVGQLVILVDDSNWLISSPFPGPQKGSSYVVSDVEIFGGEEAISLEGFAPTSFFLSRRFILA